MLCSAVFRLSELVASTNSIASVSSFSYDVLVAWTAASMPEIWPAQSCVVPAASWMSPFIIIRTDLAIIILAVLPMPMGRTPGFLSRAIRRQATKGAMLSGST